MSEMDADNNRAVQRAGTKDEPYKNASVAPYVVRPVFFVLTMVLVISAIGQAGGRLLFANLDRLEPRINELLEPRGVTLTGLRGEWRFFNPVLKISSGAAPGARFGESWAEIDTLESLSRNRVVLRNSSISDLQLTLSQDEAGAWSLDGRVPTEITFDWRSLIWHSDQLGLRANLTLRGHELPVSELLLDFKVSNFGGRHRGDLRIANQEGVASGQPGCGVTYAYLDASSPAQEHSRCDLHARYNVEESALWFRPRSGGAVLAADNFQLRDSAAALIGMETLELGTLDVRMRLLEDRFSGPIRILDSQLKLPGGKPVKANLMAEGWSEDDGDEARLIFSALQLANDTHQLEVNDSLLNWSAETGVLLRVPEVRVDDVTALVSHLLPPEVPTAMWIERLGMTGRFTRLLASWSSEAGLGFGGDFDQVAMNSFRGVPSVEQLEGSFTGGPGYLQLRLLDSMANVGFPQLYREERFYESVSGEVLMYFGQDYFGLEGSNLRFTDTAMTTQGSFSLVSTKPLTNNHITLALSSNAGDFEDLTPYVPYKLPQNVLDWLAESGLEAKLEAPRFVMHGPLREEESNMGRSYLIDAEMHDGAMFFNSQWPRITAAEGRVKVSHTSINAELMRAKLAGLALEDMTIRLPSGSESVEASGRAVFDASAGLNFIRETPLKSSMDFVADDWWAEGKMRLDVKLDFPLDEEMTGELDPRVSVAISGRLQDTTFGLPEAGLTFTNLRGPLSYRYPYELVGTDIAGKLFGRPMQLNLKSDAVAQPPAGKPPSFAPRRIDFSMNGAMHSDDMWPLLNMEPSDVVKGLFDFEAVYSTETDSDTPPMLVANTSFAGAEIRLPEPLGKSAAEAVNTNVTVVFGEVLTRANLLYRGLLNADLGIGEGGIVGGHLHLFNDQASSLTSSRADAPKDARQDTSGPRALARWDGQAGPILIDGELDFADVAQWSEGSAGDADLPPYRIADLSISRALLGDFEIPAVQVSGNSDDEMLRLLFESATATGELRVPEVGVTELVLNRFAYADEAAADPDDLDEDAIRASIYAESGERAAADTVIDPLTPEMMASLQDMNVRIESLSIDGEDYGDWRFEIRTTPQGVAFSALTANLMGINLVSPEGALWTRADNRTQIAGTLTAGDMGDVLEKWGYARSLETESMLTRASVSWPGSPLNFELSHLSGDIAAAVKTGRFLDVTSGGNTLRIFSLLNFTAIAKRMSLNFKDVFGRGISFEKVEAATRLDEGLLRFTQPMRVEGTGGDFKVNGSIDLNAGTLDNEMVVTLPVNKSLPWLGAYLALANPMVGIGVLVGERILRKPIKELSSAKYKVTGSADDPQLELVSVFDRSMDEDDAAPGKEIEVPDDLPPLEELGDPQVLEELEALIADDSGSDKVDGPVTPSAAKSSVGNPGSPDQLEGLPADQVKDQPTDQQIKETDPDGSIATSPGT